ncbi:hypothetical protein [Actinocrispum wychmicini]|nr:hypothetical protein [Actinocrispum wychmicini]
MPRAQPITQATGSFDTNDTTGTVSVKSPVPGKGVVANAYTLQLNTDFFATPLCPVGSDNCGWQQFVFANDGTSGKVYVEYWLRAYSADPQAKCPDSRYPDLHWDGTTINGLLYCVMKGKAKAVPNMPFTRPAMSNYKLIGDIESNIAIFMNGTQSYAASTPDVLGATPVWTQAEFNVFGYGEGSTAEFNLGADFRVRTDIVNGGTAEPKCTETGFSAESNNLNFVIPKPPRIQPGPAILFHQKMINLDNPGDRNQLTDGCNAAATIGDTHQVTFAGLLYDFQATGDFVDAQVGSAFEVQTRKVSGAPSWPKASVNQSVATRMGTTQVAVCEGTRLVVDGRTTALAPGGSLSLPSGVNIQRVGDSYFVKDKSGNTFRAAPNLTANPRHINLDIGLATWPTTVRGLLGNPDNDPNVLEAKDGRTFLVPPSFNDLYNKFAPSWRVAPIASMLQPCNPVASGIPAAPFFIDSLDYPTWQRASQTCLSASVAPEWLYSCALDVAVLGPTAAAAFVGRQRPAVDGNPMVRPPCPSSGCGGSGRQPR